MSAKKQAVGNVSWATCSACKVRCHNRALLQKHADLNCGEVLPLIQPNGNGLFEIAVNDDSSRLGASLKRPEGIVFINSTFLSEMKMKTLDWVRIAKVPKNEGEKLLGPVAMRVWATQWGPPYKAFFHPSAISSHPTLNSDKGAFTIQLIEDDVQVATEVTFHIPFESCRLPEKDLKLKFETWFDQKLICPGSSFTIQYLTRHIQTVASFIRIDLGSLDTSERFYRITKHTQIHFKFTGEEIRIKTAEKVSLQNVGGLAAETKEISDTVFYCLKAQMDESDDGEVNGRALPRGILIYGQHGTGKSLLIKAFCASHDLAQVTFNEFPKTTSLRNTFQEAVRIGKPACIIIENLDNLSSSRRDENQGFAQDLRMEMDRLVRRESVLVLATATNPDLIDPLLRSPHVFGKEVEIPVPSEPRRLEILQKLLEPHSHGLKMDDIRHLAQQTHGFVGADLEGLRLTAFRHAGGNPTLFHFEEAMKSVIPSAMKSIQLEIPDVRWEDIGGLEELKFQLKQSIEWPIKHPEAFERLGLTPPKGILMYGPPGCSKTMIAKALATESRLNFLSVKGSDLFSKWVGESEKSVQALFRKARQVAPAILFFDELDALGSERGQQGGASNVHERVLAQLLTEIDGIEPLKDVTIVAATNRPDLIDKALTRPGRLDRIIFVPLPDAETRREIFKIKLRKMPVGDDVTLDFLVAETEGHSGAEISGICQEAGLKALETDLEAVNVRKEHFVQALAKSPRRITPQLLSFYTSYAKENQKAN